jgi:hypothetical protein
MIARLLLAAMPAINENDGHSGSSNGRKMIRSSDN